MRSTLKLLGFGALAAGAALLGARATRTSVGGWYRRLDKPSWTPPAAAFGPVWTGLYALMAWSAWRVSRSPDRAPRRRALAWWGVQLALNAAWSPLFFGARRPGLALVDLALLLGAIAGYTRAAARVDRPAARAMAPYLAWTGYAGALNAAIVVKN